MQEADLGLTNMAMAGHGGMAPGDEQLLVKFTVESKQDPVKSEEEGRPIFKDVTYISIQVPGSRDRRFRPMREEDKARFPRHWEAFRARQEQPAEEGTPLAEWPGVTRSIAEELKFFNINTVEQLATVSDNTAMSLRGVIALKQKAIAWLDNAKDNAAAQKLDAANERINELEAKIEQLLSAKEKPRRKRRTKAEMEAAEQE